ncbi:hypothetical protein SLEP1_g47515 [Rubroshorea leprosula]|uniref:Protein kinase domain-containing protein n=1 Tax=Rubroshorea leprosula TaxID=152421 RepID=A0AAV5LSM6_9ROSI|nr:hypothetical protein SLEP1_g47515 [Rubroshorea leprosula]
MPRPGLIFVALLLLALIHETFSAKDEQNCPPSSCGNNLNISYPFRLNTDPSHCRETADPVYSLSCENNLTVLHSDQSRKFYVKAINYDNQTIRVADASVEEGSCSIPQYSWDASNFSTFSQFYSHDPYYYLMYTNFVYVWESILFISCGNLVSDPLYVEAPACINDSSFSTPYRPKSEGKRYYYVKVGRTTALELKPSCRIELMAPFIREENYGNLSYLDIHHWLAYGIELSWRYASCGKTGFQINEENQCALYVKVNPVYEVFDRAINWLSYHLPWHPYISTDGKCLENVPDYVPDYVIYIVVFCGNIVWFWILWHGPIAILGIPSFIIFLVFKWRRRHLSMYNSIEEFLQSNNNLMPVRYSYSKIKKMTNGFKEKLGEGGFGQVYKAKLQSGRFAAIKMLGKSNATGQDFFNEVATIGRIHHVNVVQMIGFCVEGSKRALVYDFMPNGSLDKHIFSREGNIATLGWENLYKISLGVARGIEYLHQGCDMQILHFDIKPHNILLDENFTPKISDFGLAKLYSVKSNTVSLTAARGTLGYMAPELFYKNLGSVSYKADVYSYGMLLMEMASRRKNVNPFVEHSSQIHFPSWASEQLNKGMELEIRETNEDEKRTAKKMIIVALWCIQMKPSDRPSMNKVIKMLEAELESLQMPPTPFQFHPHATQQDDVTEKTYLTESTSFSSCNDIEIESISLLANEN